MRAFASTRWESYTWLMSFDVRTPIRSGKSGARVVRITRADGYSWIEKSGTASEIAQEAAVLRWCADQLPVARVLSEKPDLLQVSDLPGLPLSRLPAAVASALLAKAIQQIHAIPAAGCPFLADWDLRVRDAEVRCRNGQVDESDFDDANQGRSAADIFAELRAFPIPPGPRCFTHGDASLDNFLAHNEELSGILDVGRAGIAHPAQDWALALRGMRDHFGLPGEQPFRRLLPQDCLEESLLRQFRLLDEMF